MSIDRNKSAYNKKHEDFIDEVLVVCPSCNQKAKVIAGNKETELQAETKVICTSCGFNKKLSEKPDVVLHKTSRKTITGKYLVLGGSVDPYFHFPLWLTIDCCNNTIWAYNLNHLNFIESHISSKLRERDISDISNKSIGSRLPRWMTSKNNRELVLKSIRILKVKK